MKKTYLLSILFIALLAVAILPSCRFKCTKGSGNHVTEQRKVGNFSRINISGGFQVHLKQDSSNTVSITADDNLLKYVHLEADGDELHIYYKRNLCASGEMVLNIGVRNLESLKGSGSVAFISDGKINTKDLNIKLSGSGRVDMDLTAANVFTEANGACEINLKGQATMHKVEMNGNGNIHAFDFVVGKYDIHTAGASDCEINVLNELDVHSTGASDVKYKGNPATVNSSKLGAGTVTHVN